MLSGYLNIHPNYISVMRDLNIVMSKRLYLIKNIYNNLEYNYFNKNIFLNYLLKNKNIIYN